MGTTRFTYHDEVVLSLYTPEVLCTSIIPCVF
jgi:hypothetical protein